MDLNKYRALLCAVEGGSFTAAAQRLGYTTAGIRRMITVLEEENGFPLVIRSRSGVTPTADCEQLLPMIRSLLFCGERCLHTSEGIKKLDVGQVIIGTAYSRDLQWLTEITEKFHARFPEIEMLLYKESSAALLKLLAERRIDLCIVSGGSKNADWIPLRREELAAWLPANHPLAGRKRINLGAFRREIYININSKTDRDVGQLLKEHKICPKEQLTARDRLEAAAQIAGGRGIAIQSRQILPPGYDRICVRSLEPRQFLDIGIASVKEPSMAAAKFLMLMKKSI